MSGLNDNVTTESAPRQPFWVTIIRGIQAVFNLLVLILTAYAAARVYLEGYGMAFFTFAWTVLFLLYIFLAPRFFPQLSSFLISVILEALTWLWWLVTFALLADYVRAMDGWWRWWGRAGATKAAFAFALFNWLLFSVTLGVTVWLSRGTRSHNTTVVDGTPHSSTRTGGGFSFGKFFNRNRTADVEKNTHNNVEHSGAVNETGQPVELTPQGHNAGYNGANPGYNNGTEYGGVGGGANVRAPN